MRLGNRGCRPSRQESPSTASMMTTGSVRGKCCMPQFGHSRRQPAAPTTSRVAQFEQKAPPGVPGEQRLGRGQNAGLGRGDEAAGGERADVDHFEIVAAGDDEHAPVEEAVASVRLLDDRVVRQQGGEHRRAAGETPKQRLDPRAAERLDLAERKQRLEAGVALPQHRHVARDHDCARVGARSQRRERGRVIADGGGAVERIVGVAETFEGSHG